MHVSQFWRLEARDQGPAWSGGSSFWSKTYRIFMWRKVREALWGLFKWVV